MIVIIVPICTRNLCQYAPLKSKLSMFSDCFFLKVKTLSEISVLTYLPINLPWNYFRYFHLSQLLTVIIYPSYTSNFWRYTSLKGEILSVRYWCWSAKVWCLGQMDTTQLLWLLLYESFLVKYITLETVVLNLCLISEIIYPVIYYCSFLSYWFVISWKTVLWLIVDKYTAIESPINSI